MLTLRALLVAGFAFTLTAPAHKIETLCSGVMPENDMYISVADPNAGSVTEADFNAVLDLIEQFYRPIIQAKGGTLTVNREWSNGEVNASAQQMGRSWVINMYGGLARHPVITKDAFMLVACHEIGHHIAGAPKVNNWFSSWASNEGAADYFANLRCMRSMFKDDETARFVAENAIDATVKRKCEEIYQTQAEENTCMRASMAAHSLTSLFNSMNESAPVLRFDTPDQNVVSRTNDRHPAPQCRLDTYYQASICLHDGSIELSDTNPATGTCWEGNGARDGIRPRCWFKP